MRTSLRRSRSDDQTLLQAARVQRRAARPQIVPTRGEAVTTARKTAKLWTLTVEQHGPRSLSVRVDVHGKMPKGRSTISAFRELCFDCLDLASQLEPEVSVVDDDGELPL